MNFLTWAVVGIILAFGQLLAQNRDAMNSLYDCTNQNGEIIKNCQVVPVDARKGKVLVPLYGIAGGLIGLVIEKIKSKRK